MASRILAATCFLAALAPPGTVRADDPSRHAENVVVVTLDGFRPREFFGGADETLIDAKAGGVADVAGLRRRYWRGTAEARREALLPFTWGTIARHGQVFGDASRKSPAKVTNGKKF